MQPGERKLVCAKIDGFNHPKPIGFVYFTHGGFYRATALWSGFSCGPFDSEESAVDWIKQQTVGVRSKGVRVRS